MNLSLKAKLCLFVLSAVIFVTAFAQDVSAQRRVYTASSNARVSAGSAANLDADEREVFDLVNQERSKKGLGELNWDANLSRLARAYSQKMARENFFSHYDKDGGSVDTRARDMRIKNWSKIGENLFYCEGYDSPNLLAVRGWMKSPSHRENILDPEYTDSGIGIAQSADGRIYITQVFIER
ncbi:MAG: CAP domain-containing protein [Acidobacteriota bacterium]|nr:CAP domain-containing protein [Acidobacteriota bacterium]